MATVVTFLYGDTRGYKNYENIARALSRNARPQHIRRLSGAFHGINCHQFQTTNHVQICYRYAAVASTVIYGYLQSVAVDYIRNENMLKIAPGKNQDSRSVPVDPGTSQSCPWTRDGYPTVNPGLKL